MSGNVIQHPCVLATETARHDRFREVAGRWLRLKAEHSEMSRRRWLGIMVAEFSDDDFELLTDFLCPDDVARLRKAGRFGEGVTR